MAAPTTYRMKPYTVMRDETIATNLVGPRPTPLLHSPNRDAHLLERRSDQRLFLLIGATTDAAVASKWLRREIANLETQAVLEERPHFECWWRTDPQPAHRPRLPNIEATRDAPDRITRAI